MVELALGTLGWSSKYPETDMCAMLRMAEEHSLAAIDTANGYDDGRTESRIAAFGTRLPVWTKAGLARVQGKAEGLEPSALRAAIEGSMMRLGVQSIDRLYLHAPDPRTPLEHTLAELALLVGEGKVRQWGISNYPAWRVVEALTIAASLGLAPPTDLQVLFNLYAREAEIELLPMARVKGIGVSVYNPLAGGRLARTTANPQGRLETNSYYRSRYGTTELLDRARQVEELARDHGLCLAECALRAVISQGDIGTIVLGARTPAQLEELIRWSRKGPLPAELAKALSAATQRWRGMKETYARGH